MSIPTREQLELEGLLNYKLGEFLYPYQDPMNINILIALHKHGETPYKELKTEVSKLGKKITQSPIVYKPKAQIFKMDSFDKNLEDLTKIKHIRKGKSGYYPDNLLGKLAARGLITVSYMIKKYPIPNEAKKSARALIRYCEK